MKTSNYIILSFFICLFGGIFILFLSSKLDPRSKQNRGFVTEEKKIDNFSVVVAEPGAHFSLKNGEYPRMCMSSFKSDSCKFPLYAIRNDTIFVFSYPEKAKYQSTEIYGKDIKAIVGKENSRINMNDWNADSLRVVLSKADFRYYSEKNPTTFSLKLIANDSYINLQKANIDKLNLNLSHTQMDSWNNRIKNLSGKLNEKSRLYLGRIQKINIEADSTSTYRLEK